MTNLPPTLKDDFKAIQTDMMNAVMLAETGDPEKIIEFPKAQMIDTIRESSEFRLYMLNPDNIPVMILPSVPDDKMAAIMTIAFQYSTLTEQDRVQGLKSLVGSMKKIVEKVENGVITLTDLFSLWLFTGPHLIGCYEIDATTACLLSLASSHLNAYDHILDSEYVNGVIDEALSELDDDQL